MKTGFSVLRFSLKPSADGRLTQEVRFRGEYADVEQAFAAARTEALCEWQEWINQQRLSDDPQGEVALKIKDTEWGYELHCDQQVISRYWLHDNMPAVIGET